MLQVIPIQKRIIDSLIIIRFAGMTYYRLKQVDKDGKFEYSETRRVNMSSQGLDVVATPNPFRTTVTLYSRG